MLLVVPGSFDSKRARFESNHQNLQNACLQRTVPRRVDTPYPYFGNGVGGTRPRTLTVSGL